MGKLLTALADHFRARPLKPSEIALFLMVVFFAVFHRSLPEELPLTQSKVGATSRSLGELAPPYDFEIREISPNEKLDFD